MLIACHFLSFRCYFFPSLFNAAIRLVFDDDDNGDEDQDFFFSIYILAKRIHRLIDPSLT